MSQQNWIPESWTFRDAKVASHFDRHVREQLPWYDLVTESVAHFGRHYIPRDGIVYDIGASIGNIGTALKDTLDSRRCEFVAIEQSPELCALYKGPTTLVNQDALTYEFQQFDFAVCFLVLMFLPVKDQREFVLSLAAKIRPGGALLIMDKIQTPGGYFGTAVRRMAMSWKLQTGVTADEIVAKELSLAGYQRPITPEAILPAGAQQFFRFGEFAGWVIEQ